MLASVLIKKMKQCSENPVYIEFGTVKKNGDLVTDTFQKPITAGKIIPYWSTAYVVVQTASVTIKPASAAMA